MSSDHPDYLENTHNSLKLFYTILLTISLGQGVVRFIEHTLTPGFSRLGVLFSPEFAVLILFLLLTIRFLLGGVRHLDATYLEESFDNVAESRIGSTWFRAMDFGLLTADGLILVLIGTAVMDIGLFFETVTLLLLVDGIWALAVSTTFGTNDEDLRDNYELIWGVNNVIFGGILIVLFVLIGSPSENVLWFLVAVLLNSFIDLVLTHDYYIPELTPEGEPVSK